MNNKILHSLGHAVLVVAYVSLVAWIMRNGQQWFKPEDTIFAPIAFLLLFVLSASVVATLVLGRPILMYLNGQKQEALRFFGWTVLWLFVLTIVAFLVLVIKK